MRDVFPLRCELPPDARPALEIVRTLVDAGHEALLAGGCVRDLLLRRKPIDFDIATDAPPDTVCKRFRATRRVGAQFGVVLVRKHRRWVEVATFRTDGPYLDGRRPSTITIADAEHDALRRDFTVNGMFLDPVRMEVIDYVGGRADLELPQLRAIGEPAARFDEDYLRLLRAVRFAAKLDFPIEPATLDAIQSHAPLLARVAAERVHEELRRMLSHPSRQRAWQLIHECGLAGHLWSGAGWEPEQVRRIDTLLSRLSADAPFELALTVIVAAYETRAIQKLACDLTLSNEERDTTLWLVEHRNDLVDPAAPSLATLKQLMAHPAFDALHALTNAGYEDLPDGPQRRQSLAERVRAVPTEAVQPPPLVTGEDLLGRGLEPGPQYKEILDALYVRQLDEELRTRDQALAALDQLLQQRGSNGCAT